MATAAARSFGLTATHRRIGGKIAGALLSLAFVAAFPYVTRRLFDTAIPSGEMSEVFKLLGVLAVAFVISLLAAVRQAYQTASRYDSTLNRGRPVSCAGCTR